MNIVRESVYVKVILLVLACNEVITLVPAYNKKCEIIQSVLNKVYAYKIIKKIYLLIQGLAEIGKHFKILVTHFSARVSMHIGVLTEAATFEISQHEALGR